MSSLMKSNNKLSKMKYSFCNSIITFEIDNRKEIKLLSNIHLLFIKKSVLAYKLELCILQSYNLFTTL